MPGNIRKRQGKRGVSYIARIDIGRDEHGKRIQECRTFRTKTEAQEWLTKTHHQLLNNSYVKPSSETVLELVERWLASRRDLSESSRATYQSPIRNHIGPLLGHVPIGKLTANHIQDAYNKRSGSVPHNMHRVLRPALDWAVKRREITRNPCDGVIVPSRKASDEDRAVAVWTAAELVALLEAARANYAWYYPIIATLAASGMRPGEAIALQWDDVDLLNRKLHIRRTISRQSSGGFRVIDRPKRSSGRRIVAIDLETNEVLKSRWRELERIRHLRPKFGANFVFPSVAGKQLDIAVLDYALQRSAQFAHVSALTPHALRHTHASLLLSAGRPVHYVQRRLGHASAATTLKYYAHLIPGTDHLDADTYAGLLKDSGVKTVHTLPPDRRIAP